MSPDVILDLSEQGRWASYLGSSLRVLGFTSRVWPREAMKEKNLRGCNKKNLVT